MAFVAAACIFIGVITWIFALRTEDLIWLFIYALLSGTAFAAALYIKLTGASL